MCVCICMFVRVHVDSRFSCNYNAYTYTDTLKQDTVDFHEKKKTTQNRDAGTHTLTHTHTHTHSLTHTHTHTHTHTTGRNGPRGKKKSTQSHGAVLRTLLSIRFLYLLWIQRATRSCLMRLCVCIVMWSWAALSAVARPLWSSRCGFVFVKYVCVFKYIIVCREWYCWLWQGNFDPAGAALCLWSMYVDCGHMYVLSVYISYHIYIYIYTHTYIHTHTHRS